jgi:hypothetical protein
MRLVRVELMLLAGAIVLLSGCTRNRAQDVPEVQPRPEPPPAPVDLPLLTFSDAHPWKTDLGSNFGVYVGPEERLPREADERPVVTPELEWENGNPYVALRFARLKPPHHFAGLWLSVFGHVDDTEVTLPPDITQRLNAVSFRARAPEGGVHFKVELKTATGEAQHRYYDATEEWQPFAMPVPADARVGIGGALLREQLKEIVFVIESRLQPGGGQEERTGVLELDDVALSCDGDESFAVPESDEAFLDWIRDRCLHYFMWNYREPEPGRGIVLERNSFHDLVSVAGIGHAFPAFIVADTEGLLEADAAKARVVSMLRWLTDLDCGNGASGWHGFPYHFLRPDGSRAPKSEVGTIDWAICAAGIRVARQYYAGDGEVEGLAAKLLDRPQWQASVTKSGRVSHGFDGGGKQLEPEWGSSFTEESYLVALEAVASGDLEPGIFATLKREVRMGFWPSSFGSGFTYNWLQLWTGPREPFATNSKRAYEADADFCAERYGRPTMGCTAQETFSGKGDGGFLEWDTYAGETGSDVHLIGEDAVLHFSVAPYGAALALPFVRDRALTALREYVALGFVHPLLGFPDSVRLEGLPEEAHGPVPHWTQFAIDVGPMWLAIEACSPDGRRTAALYLADEDIKAALGKLDESLAGWEQELTP